MKVNGITLEPGNCYTFYKPETETEIYRQLPEVKDYRVILKMHPRDVVPKYNLNSDYVIWLSKVEDPNCKCRRVDPFDIADINKNLCQDASHLKPGIKHIHFGTATINELIAYNRLDSASRLIHTLADKVVSDERVMTVDLKPGCFTEKDYAQFIRCGQFTELDFGEKPNPNVEEKKPVRTASTSPQST